MFNDAFFDKLQGEIPDAVTISLSIHDQKHIYLWRKSRTFHFVPASDQTLDFPPW